MANYLYYIKYVPTNPLKCECIFHFHIVHNMFLVLQKVAWLLVSGYVLFGSAECWAMSNWCLCLYMQMCNKQMNERDHSVFLFFRSKKLKWTVMWAFLSLSQSSVASIWYLQFTHMHAAYLSHLQGCQLLAKLKWIY